MVNKLTLPAKQNEVVSKINEIIDDKQDTLVSGTNIKTINNTSILGSGNIDIQGGGGSYTAGDYIDITNNVISAKVSTRTDLIISPTPQTQYYAWSYHNYGDYYFDIYTTSATPSVGDSYYYYSDGVMTEEIEYFIDEVASDYSYIIPSDGDYWYYYRDSSKDLLYPSGEASDAYAPSQKAVKTYVDNLVGDVETLINAL